MIEIIKAYPLAWPVGWKRTEPVKRRRAQFGKSVHVPSSTPGVSGYSRKGEISIADAVARCGAELRRIGISDEDTVISTNLKLRLDGLPRSDQRRPDDPGAAVYWVERSSAAKRCMAIDRYDLVEHNLAAIAATLDAMRAIERHGGAEILDRAFTGFIALPAPTVGQKPWRQVFGFKEGDEVSPTCLEDAWRALRSAAHPDKGGSPEAFQGLQQAYEAGCRELGNPP